MSLRTETSRELIHLPHMLADKFGISRSEARRALAQHAVKVNGETTTDLDIEGPVADLQLGKRRHWPAEGSNSGQYLRLQEWAHGRGLTVVSAMTPGPVVRLKSDPNSAAIIERAGKTTDDAAFYIINCVERLGVEVPR